MQRAKVINKLALVLLSIVVLELILIGDQVQPVKAIKKKIYLKKLKKILPLLALVKPKKKLILVPIPIPMFKKEPYHGGYGPQHQHMMMGAAQPMSVAGSSEAMSFMMMEPNSSVGPSLLPPPPAPAPSATSAGMQHESESSSMMMPSMTMTIQSDGTGTMSAIELTPGSGRPMMMAAPALNSSAPLMAAGRPGNSKWPEQQQHDYLADEQFEQHQSNQPRPGEGDHYYASPWANTATTTPNASRLPLVSPAKFLRNGRLKLSPQQQQQQYSAPAQKLRWISPTRRPVGAQSGRLETRPGTQQPALRQQPMTTTTTTTTTSHHQAKSQFQTQKYSAPMPVVIIKNHWRPAPTVTPPVRLEQQSSNQEARNSGATSHAGGDRQWPSQLKLSKQQEQQIASALEQESLVQVGPARMVPIYQVSSGRISMTPPPMRAAASESSATIASEMASVESPTTSGGGGGSTLAGGELISTSSDSQNDANTEVQTSSQLANSVFRPGSMIATTTIQTTSHSHPDQSFEHVDSSHTSAPVSDAPLSGRLSAAGANSKTPNRRPTSGDVKRASADLAAGLMMEMPMMDNYDMPMDYQQQSYGGGGGGGGGSGGGGQTQSGY